MTWQYEADGDRLNLLRQRAAAIRRQLIDAEAALADKQGEIRQIESILETRLGHYFDQLEAVETDLADFYDRIQRRRNATVFGSDYRSVDEQYRRVWQKPAEEASPTVTKTAVSLSDTDMKKLYRKLARQHHPDLAANDADRAARTAKMSAINDAYAARNSSELLALAEESDTTAAATYLPQATETIAEMARALEAEISRCQLRIQEIKIEIEQFHHHPIVQMSLEMKLARRRGRDVLTEIATKLKRKIAQKTAERDMIKTQFDHLQ